MYQPSDIHTSEHIFEMLQTTCAEWLIDKDKISIVGRQRSDKSEGRGFGFWKQHIPCSAHTVILVA